MLPKILLHVFSIGSLPCGAPVDVFNLSKNILKECYWATHTFLPSDLYFLFYNDQFFILSQCPATGYPCAGDQLHSIC